MDRRSLPDRPRAERDRCYSTDTLFTGIRRLTERATAYFGGRLSVRYPAPALHTGPRELVPEAHVLGALIEALDDALDVRPLDPDRTIFHLTGGFDSGTVATRAAERSPGRLNTAALLIGGPAREQQIRRRAEMRAAVTFGPVDELVDAMVEPAGFHKTIYKRRSEVERTINALKNSRAVATGFDKRASVFHGIVTVASIRVRLKP